MARLDLEGLHALLAISKSGGVTRAADMLSLSQPAVSHKIKRLEQVLGCDLLTRRSGGPLFTEAGEQLLAYANQMLDLNDNIFAKLAKQTLIGTIRLGMTEDTTGGDIARILGKFTRYHPDAKVVISVAQSLSIAKWLDEGAADIGIMQLFDDALEDDDIVIFSDQLYWVKSPSLLLEKQDEIPFLSFDKNCFYRHWAQKQMSESGHSITPVFECPSIGGILSATKAGLGVALINGLHLSNDLEILDGFLPTPPAIHYVVRARKSAQDAVMDALLTEILAELRRAVPLRVA
ncbi:MAG: LysR family transcriptional regulator [Candidatus Puniceispirillaceae bacterium]